MPQALYKQIALMRGFTQISINTHIGLSLLKKNYIALRTSRYISLRRSFTVLLWRMTFVFPPDPNQHMLSVTWSVKKLLS